MKPLHFSPLLLILSLAHLGLIQSYQHPKCTLPEDKGRTLKVIHVSSPCSPLSSPKAKSWEESVVQTLLQDRARLAYLSSLIVVGKSDSPVASGRQLIQSPTYLVNVKVGTPPQSFLMALDTSSDAAWLPCNGCLGCSSSAGSSLFSFDKSSSFAGIGCGTSQCSKVTYPTCSQKQCTFNQTCGGSTISSTLSQDTMTLAQDKIPGYLFGCVETVTGGISVPPQGLLGLGRGPLSLMSQTQSLYKSTFSYCLPSFRSTNSSGSLRLGPVAQPQRMPYTPLLTNPKRPSLYYVNLLGIKVGSKTVDIPADSLAFNPNTGAGTVIDSGTVYTRLVEAAYTAVRDEFRRRMGKATVSTLGGFDTCYTAAITVPSITFMLEGLNMTMSEDNFLIRSAASNLACLAMAAAPSFNVIANMQQQNRRVLYDIPNSRIGIAWENCS